MKTSGKKINGIVQKIPTGIEGLDITLDGGLPKGRSTLILGGPGTGKTVLLNEFLYRGIMTYQENAVYISFEEAQSDMIKNVAGFGWNYNALIAEKKLAFVDASPLREPAVELNQEYDLNPLLERMRYAIKKVNAKRLAIDSIGALFARFQNKTIIREMLYQLSAEIKHLGVTALISAEKSEADTGMTRHHVDEFVFDGVIALQFLRGQQQYIRQLHVVKLRGTSFRSGIVEYDISARGMVIYPKIPIETNIAFTDIDIRKKFGIHVMDELMGGGIPQGHMMLISGNTGAGKSTLAGCFLNTGIMAGENEVFVNLEEPTDQIKKIGLSRGWHFNHYENDGRLAFVNVSLIDLSHDQLLNLIISAVERINAKRVVFDSISNLMSATMDKEQTRQFLLQLTSYFKRKGITCVFSYLSSTAFGAVRGQLLSNMMTTEMRISSIMDGIMLLLFVERGQRVKTLMNILKMRGSQHSKEIYKYEIDAKGVTLGDPYEE